jgi:hypothetical protein
MSLTVDVEIIVWCELVKPGCTFYARITDGPRAKFYGGSGNTALEAIAWALDEYVCRGMLDMGHSPTRSGRPGDRVHRDVKPDNVPPPTAPRPTHYARDRELDAPSAKEEIACFESRIPPAKRPRLAQQPLRAQRPRSA